jgi:hypothetical protein
LLKAARNSFLMPGPAAFRFHDDCAGHSSFYQGEVGLCRR